MNHLLEERSILIHSLKRNIFFEMSFAANIILHHVKIPVQCSDIHDFISFCSTLQTCLTWIYPVLTCRLLILKKKINCIEKIEWQTIWIQIKPNIFSGLIWVQTDCKGYQQMSLVGKEFKTVYIWMSWLLRG